MAETLVDLLAVSAAFMPMSQHECIAEIVVDDNLSVTMNFDLEWVSQNPGFIESLNALLSGQSIAARLDNDHINIEISPDQTRTQVLNIATALQGKLTEAGSKIKSGPAQKPRRPAQGTNDQELLRNVPPHHGT